MVSREKMDGTWPDFALWSQLLWQGNEERPTSKPLEPALYLVSTPIGNLGDLTLRGLWTLFRTDVIFCEDTRVTGRLLHLYGLPKKKLVSCHEHNEKERCKDLLSCLEQGQAVVFASDAGTPALSDPGYRLVCACHERGFPVVVLPGASALLTALSGAGLPTDQFFFAGFPPAKRSARLDFFKRLVDVPGTLVFYETGPRLADSLADMAAILKSTRQSALARELTKLHETLERGSLFDLCEKARVRQEKIKGELVVLLGPAPPQAASLNDIDKALFKALSKQSVRDAATTVAAALSVKKSDVYQRALTIKRGGGKD